MKQLLLRVDEELHARLTAQARAKGVSVNALANDILGLGIDPHALSRTDRLRLKLMAIGVLGSRVTPPGAAGAPSPQSDAERDRALDSLRGVGPIADDLIDYERDRP